MLYALWHTMNLYSYMAGNFNYLNIKRFQINVSNVQQNFDSGPPSSKSGKLVLTFLPVTLHSWQSS